MKALSALAPQVRQYLLVTASAATAGNGPALPLPASGPTGLIAYALPTGNGGSR